MDERILAYFYDIKAAIEEIESFFQDKPKLFEEFTTNTMLRRAIERNLEIIGEAVNRILKRDEKLIAQISNAGSIVGLRNKVIHSYDTVSFEMI